MVPQDFGPYTLVEEIAAGGMAQIYLAKTRGIAGFEKFLALKLLHPSYANDDQFIEMLIEEAKIAVRLNHINIGQVFDLGHVDDRYYIAMEYIDGPDLFRMMRRLTERDIDVPIDVATYIAQELCTGLDYAHRQRGDRGEALNIIHRDISPQNVLISVAGEVKLVDFGIAKATSRSVSTQAGVIKGKYFYMSPEQAWGDPIDQRSDIFSAGIILYEVLTGQMLYLEEDMQRLLDLVRKAEIPPPSDKRRQIPGALEEIVMRALAKDREDRWPTAQEMQLALTNFLFSHAPDFTPDRLAKLVDRALEDFEEEEEEEETRAARSFISRLPALDGTEPGDALMPARDGKASTQQVEVDALMQRDDYNPDQEASVIFRLDQLVPDDDDDDRGEVTVVSGPPPEMVGRNMLGLDRHDTGELEDGDWEEVPGEPTVVNRLPDEPVRPGSAAEVIVPAGSAEEPTLVGERRPSALRLRPQKADETTHKGATHKAPRASRPLPPPPPAAEAPPVSKRVSLPDQPPVSWAPSWPPVPAPADANASTAPQALPAASSSAPNWPPAAGTPIALAPQSPTAQSAPNWPPAAPNWPPAGSSAPTPAQEVPQAAGLDPAGVFSSAPPEVSGASQLAQRAAAASSGQQPTMGQPPSVDAGPGSPGWPDGQPQWPTGPGDAFSGMSPLELEAEWPSDEARARRRRRLVLVMILAAVAIALLGVVAFFLTSGLEQQPATIQVVSVPRGAEVWLNGKKAPKRTSVDLPVADPSVPHNLEVRMEHHTPEKSVVRFPEGQRFVRVVAVLRPIYGKLQVNSTPPGADVYLNSEHRGRTPTVVEGLSLSEEINLELRKRGYRPETRTFKWEGQRFRKVVVTLKRSR